jgi:hypothetical protein
MGAYRAGARRHVVLIPGFGGFDALGQLEYYAGVTLIFRKLLAGERVVLHYFDNLPTAAVVTRAARLRKYLAKRIARGELSAGEEITLVGHSTGGLDIRQLIADLEARPADDTFVDGEVPVKSRDILAMVRRVVFLSVPHWGTNIADWVRSHTALRKVIIAELRAEVVRCQIPLLNRMQDWVAGGAACLTKADLLLAIQDALNEADASLASQSPGRRAAAHEAEAQLELYLRHAAWDFHAIDDLATRRSPERPVSPAHFTGAEREKEFKAWDDLDIDTRSYVTVSGSPFRFEPRAPAPVWKLANPFSWPELEKDAQLSENTDLVYRACYRACAGGPFRIPAEAGRIARRLGPASRTTIRNWDNDGIVNTGSMLWPYGENVLVECDHMDIAGHFRRIETGGESGRRFRSYDLLKSAPLLQPEIFDAVWTEIFDFSAGRERATPPESAAAAAARAKR